MAWEAARRHHVVALATALLLLTVPIVPTGLASGQDDAGSGGDAGDSLSTATPVSIPGSFQARLDPGAGDTHDYFSFHLEAGENATAVIPYKFDVEGDLEMIDPNGVVIDQSPVVAGIPVSATGTIGERRVSVIEAQQAGTYALHVNHDGEDALDYTVCFSPCDEPQDAPLYITRSHATTNIRVLLVPPPHGDLGDPFGPTVLDYLDATVQGVQEWELAIDSFTDDYPEFSYLDAISVHLEIADDPQTDAAGYDAVIHYIPTSGYAFRGVAATGGCGPDWMYHVGDATVHTCGLTTTLSLFAAAARSGQTMPDYAEVTDLHGTTMHEFGHNLGLIHTLHWTEEHGPDLMNSPAPFVWGNGDPAGDGGYHTPRECISSLDLYAIAVAYDWLEEGVWESRDLSGDPVTLPDDIPYELYCEDPPGLAGLGST